MLQSHKSFTIFCLITQKDFSCSGPDLDPIHPVDREPGTGTFSRTAVGEEDVFVMKLSASGSFAFGASMGGAGLDRGQGIAVDGSGNVYVVGLFNGQSNFNPNLALPFYLYGNPGYAMFYVKLTQPNP